MFRLWPRNANFPMDEYVFVIALRSELVSSIVYLFSSKELATAAQITAGGGGVPFAATTTTMMMMDMLTKLSVDPKGTAATSSSGSERCTKTVRSTSNEADVLSMQSDAEVDRVNDARRDSAADVPPNDHRTSSVNNHCSGVCDRLEDRLVTLIGAAEHRMTSLLLTQLDRIEKKLDSRLDAITRLLLKGPNETDLD